MEYLVGGHSSVSLATTIRNMLRKLMKRELAMKMSYSGLGEKRQCTKHCFKEHATFGTLIG